MPLYRDPMANRIGNRRTDLRKALGLSRDRFSEFCRPRNFNSFDMVRCCAPVSKFLKARLFRES